MIRSIIQYYQTNSTYVLAQMQRHFLIAFYGVLLATLIAVPISFLIAKNRRLSNNVIKFAMIVQTIPALALLSLLIVVVGLGVNTVILAVFIYSLLPILTSSINGINSVDPNIIDAAIGMGMNSLQLVLKVKLPLSIKMIFGGIRNAFVMAIGVTAVGTFIGAGGLGDIISRGLNVADGSTIIWAGAIPTAMMAIFIDISFQLIENHVMYKEK